MAIGQFNSGLETSKSFRPGLHRKFQSPLKRMLGWAVFLFLERYDENKNKVSFDNSSRCDNRPRGLVHSLQGVLELVIASVPKLARLANITEL